jgi:hypothetical protein
MDLSTMDLSTQTPVEIDTELARLYYESADASFKSAQAANHLHYAADDEYNTRYNPRSGWKMSHVEVVETVTVMAQGQTYKATEAQRALDAYNAAHQKVEEIREAMVPFHAEYRRRPWSRAFLVQNNNGHVHSSMECSTCFDTTQYAWMVEYSGKPESEIVEAAGEAACTVCYPSAPVDVLKRPTKMFGPDQIAAQKARQEREEAKAARLAKKIEKGLTADGSEFTVSYVEKNAPQWKRGADGRDVHTYGDRVKTEFFKTEQAAVQWVVQYVTWHGWNGDEAYGFQQVIEAVAAKHGQTYEQAKTMIVAKVAAKAKRDSRY